VGGSAVVGKRGKVGAQVPTKTNVLLESRDRLEDDYVRNWVLG
jgi:hypothetical protein